MSEFNFQETVNTGLQKIIDGGGLTAMIEKQIEKSVNEIVVDSLKAYSDFGRNLSEAVKGALSIDTGRLNLDEYNMVVLSIVRQKIEAAISLAGRERLSKDMDDLLGATAPAEIKLSDLIKEFKKWAVESKQSHCCTIIIEESEYRSRWIYLDPAGKKSKYECQFQILTGSDGGGVTFCKLGGVNPKEHLFLGTLYGFPRTVFRLYASGTNLVIDETDFDNEIESEYGD